MREELPPSKPISIVIVDDFQILTDALRIIFSSQLDIHVLAVAPSCSVARELLSQTCPDVLLLDVVLPDGDGLDLASEIKRKCPTTHTLVMTTHVDEKTALRAIGAGISGFVLKTQPLPEMISLIRQAAKGDIVMPANLFVDALNWMQHTHARKTTQHRIEPITRREEEILVCLAKGMSGSHIADTLHIAPLTVRTHIRNLMDKLGVHSRLEAVSHALSHGLIHLPL